MTLDATSARGSSGSRGHVKIGTLAAAQLLRVLPRTKITRAVGQLCDRPLSPVVSKAIVSLYASAWGVDLAEALMPEAGGAFPNFDAFFTRRLRSGARDLPARDDVLISPSDGVLQAAGHVSEAGVIEVKGKPYRAADLLRNRDEVQYYRQGQYAVIYLSPGDYHRVHAPAAGRVTQVRSEPGDLFPVNGLGARIPGLLSRNRRAAIVVETESFGRITVVMVAAMLVGRITVVGLGEHDVPIGTHLLRPPIDVAAGDELGIFHLGSTVVMFVPPQTRVSWQRELGPIRMGVPLGPVASEATVADDAHSTGPSRGET